MSRAAYDRRSVSRDQAGSMGIARKRGCHVVIWGRQKKETGHLARIATNRVQQRATSPRKEHRYSVFHVSSNRSRSHRHSPHDAHPAPNQPARKDRGHKICQRRAGPVGRTSRTTTHLLSQNWTASPTPDAGPPIVPSVIHLFVLAPRGT